MLVEVTDLQGAADDNKAQISGAKAYGNMDIVLQFDSEGRSEIVLLRRAFVLVGKHRCVTRR